MLRKAPSQSFVTRSTFPRALQRRSYERTKLGGWALLPSFTQIQRENQRRSV